MLVCYLLLLAVCFTNTLYKTIPYGSFIPIGYMVHSMTVIVYALFTMPISILLFLSRFPEKWVWRGMYILLWSGIYIAVEWILYVSGRISYQNGWEFWYSFPFDIAMFSVIAIHQKYPFLAYILSIIITTFMIAYFHVPFTFVY